mgnify:CR=1 FL=1
MFRQFMAVLLDYEPLTGHLNATLPRCINEVEGFLTPGLTTGTVRWLGSQFGVTDPLVIRFKFGITNDLKKRAAKYIPKNGKKFDYDYMEPLYRTTRYSYSQDMERGLIDHFENSPFAGNLRKGGAGRKPDSGPYYTYVVYDTA